MRYNCIDPVISWSVVVAHNEHQINEWNDQDDEENRTAISSYWDSGESIFLTFTFFQSEKTSKTKGEIVHTNGLPKQWCSMKLLSPHHSCNQEVWIVYPTVRTYAMLMYPDIGHTKKRTEREPHLTIQPKSITTRITRIQHETKMECCSVCFVMCLVESGLLCTGVVNLIWKTTLLMMSIRSTKAEHYPTDRKYKAFYTLSPIRLKSGRHFHDSFTLAKKMNISMPTFVVDIRIGILGTFVYGR